MIHPVKIFRTWRNRLRLVRRMGIRPDEVVLEVGSGQNPSPRANVLCDRFLVDDVERNEQAVRVDRPFVAGDIYRLPFRKHAFDFVICSHVLEHLERPEEALAELTRVAPRGYIETPSRVNEKVLSYPFHRWLITRRGDRLHFQEKQRPIWDEELNAWFRRLGTLFPPLYDFFFANLEELGNVVALTWEGDVQIEVERVRRSDRIGGIDELDENETEEDDEGTVVAGFVAAGSGGGTEEELRDEVEQIRRVFAGEGGGGWRHGVESWIARLFRLRSDPVGDLDGRLRCPRCREKLERDRDNGFRCPSCGCSYPVVDVAGRAVPFLVAPKRDRATGGHPGSAPESVESDPPSSRPR